MKKILTGRAYQMTITLRGIRPPIWRRVQVPGAIRLAALHEAIPDKSEHSTASP